MRLTYDISIIIPAYNEEQYISECLNSILNQTYDASKIEILVCDGNSTDKTQHIIKEFSTNHPNIKLLINKHQTTPFALNLGITSSSSDIKMILGAHSYLDKHYIDHCLNIFNTREDVHCVGGVIENIYENKQSQTIGLAMSSTFGVGNAHFRTGTKNGFVDTVAFGAYKQEVFDICGLFDTDLKRNQDDEFNYRLEKNHLNIWLDNSLRSKYYVRASYKKLFRQYFQYGYWKVFVNTKHKTVTSIRQLIPFLFVCYLCLASTQFLISIKFGLIALMPLVFYFIGAIYFASKKTIVIPQLFQVIFVFLILHLSYGLGYLKGIINFSLLRRKPNTVNPNITR